MSSLEERVAVLESLVERNQNDTTALFTMLREHMKKEDDDRELFLTELSNIRIMQQKQKSFVGGVVFTVSSVWAFLVGSLMFLRSGGGTP